MADLTTLFVIIVALAACITTSFWAFNFIWELLVKIERRLREGKR